jgi:hypothetical protein
MEGEEDMIRLLSDHQNDLHPICVPESEDIRKVTTAGYMVINIKEGKMIAGRGGPHGGTGLEVGVSE